MLPQRRNDTLAEDEFLPIVDGQAPPADAGRRWKMAVIDGDPAVHEGVRLALAGFMFHGRRLDILSASQLAEGRDLMSRHPDIAVVLLNVVMETGNAGLHLVDYIRNTLKNEAVRIILRTGEPPDRRIIVDDDDINDCKAKTELTADSLFTTLTAALRSYQQIQRIADLQQANVRLSAQCARLRRADALKREILETVAHSLKNPLGVILSRVEMLSEMVGDGASPVDGVKAQIAHIRTAAQQVREFVESLIADAMADALDIAIRPERVDLVALLRDLVEANQPLAARKRQTITFSAPEAIELTCDSDRIREAIDNVLSNAIKYSPIGGRIGVAAERSGLAAVIRITDQGPGLSAEDRARLFGRFQRLSAKPTGSESSTGLGLSIVKRIVDLHGGTVTAETTDPSGTTFKIAIPTA